MDNDLKIIQILKEMVTELKEFNDKMEEKDE